ncbi:MAG: hypothetical protein J0H99_17005, partial [Rhodospirillales bacterium]|nr:hypothetical protein [Rhodospirillales bacterium]
MSRPIEDGARRMAQLTDYRRRRASGHQDGRSDRDRREIAQTQPDIEVLDGQQRGLQKRVATEAPMIAGASDLAAG